VDVAAASDIWQRAIDAADSAKLPFGTTVQVSEGTNFGTWTLVSTIVTLGAEAVRFINGADGRRRFSVEAF